MPAVLSKPLYFASEYTLLQDEIHTLKDKRMNVHWWIKRGSVIVDPTPLAPPPRPTQHVLGGHVARVAVVNLGSGELLCRVIGDPVALREPLGRIEPLPRVKYLGRLDP